MLSNEAVRNELRDLLELLDASVKLDARISSSLRSLLGNAKVGSPGRGRPKENWQASLARVLQAEDEVMSGTGVLRKHDLATGRVTEEPYEIERHQRTLDEMQQEIDQQTGRTREIGSLKKLLDPPRKPRANRKKK